jgi:TolB protein
MTARAARADGTTARLAAVHEATTREAAAREAAAGLALRLTFVDVADGTILSQRSIQASDLFVNQVLPFFDQYALSHRFWAPDGTAIVLPVVGDGDVTRLLAIPADGSDARLIATAEFGSWSP